MINAYWACKDIGNVGDMMTPYIISAITNQGVKHNKDKPHYIVVGSILWEANRYSTVLGAGLGDHNQKVNPEANVIFVRGPLTKHWCKHGSNREVRAIQDPAVVMPLLYSPAVDKDCKLGVVPHYVDAKRVRTEKGIKIISVTQSVESYVKQILTCEMIISSSLHGIITAHAYGIPALWVEFSDEVLGNGFKFYDYFMGSGVTVYQPVDLRNQVVTREIINTIPQETGNASYMAAQVLEVLRAHLQ